MKKTQLLLGMAAAAAMSVAQVHAQNLTATFLEVSSHKNVKITFNGNSHHAETVSTGILNFDFGDAFCVEPFQSVSPGQEIVYTIQDPSTLNGSDIVARLVGGYLASAQTDLDAAAVQAAIWEVVTGDGGSLYNGQVKITNPDSVANKANDYLANVDSFTPAEFVYLTNSHKQDVITWSPVPEPSSALLLGLGSLVLFRRRR